MSGLVISIWLNGVTFAFLVGGLLTFRWSMRALKDARYKLDRATRIMDGEEVEADDLDQGWQGGRGR